MNVPKLLVSAELFRNVQKWLLEVVVALCRYVVILQILFAMESNHLRFDLSILDFDLVSSKHHRNVFANSRQVAVPVWDVFVPCKVSQIIELLFFCSYTVRKAPRDSRCHVEHDNSTLSLDVISITEAAKFLLSGGVPYVEPDRPSIRVKHEGVDLHTKGRYRKNDTAPQSQNYSRLSLREAEILTNIFLFKFSCEVALDERCLSDTTITNEDQLKLRNIHRCLEVQKRIEAATNENKSVDKKESRNAWKRWEIVARQRRRS
jgi:hypothetical protein